ncbi:MAG: AI-2E family transporter [SAR324 cluster bacterium]|nr:AI-2E family transporter [SAR324 cluster bacterium]
MPDNQMSAIGAFVVRYARFGALVLLTGLVLATLYFFHAVLLPFILAVFLSYLIAPIIDRLTRIRFRGIGMRRGLAIIVTYTVFFSGIFVAGRFVVPNLVTEFNKIVKELPHMLVEVERNWIQPLETDLSAWIGEFIPDPAEGDIPADTTFAANGAELAADGAATDASQPRAPWEILVEDYTYVVRQIDGGHFEVVPRKKTEQRTNTAEARANGGPISGAFGQMRQIFEENFFELIQLGRRHLTAIVGSFFTTFLVFFISAFILADPQRIWDFLCSLVPPQYRGEFNELLRRLDHGLSGVVRGQLMICVVNGALTGLGLIVLGVPFVFTLTLIATLFSLIPIFGVLISSVPIVLMAFSISATTALLAVGWILVIHFIEANFLNPKILGGASKIHPILIIFALLVGQYTAGIVGALIAVPIFSLVQNSFLYIKSVAENLETPA